MSIQQSTTRSPLCPPIARLCALVACAAVAAVPAATPGLAATSVPPLRHDVGAFALYGRTSVTWAGAASMPLRTGVGAETSVEFSARTEATGADSLVAGGLVTLRDSSHVHAVYASTLDAAAGTTLNLPAVALVPPVVAAIDWPAPPQVACGGADVTVDSGNSPLALAPGRYGNVTVQQDQVLRLAAGGRYEFCSMRVRSGATVESHTGTFVLLRDYLVTAARARLVGDGACGARWVALAATPSPAPASAGFEFGQGTGSSNRARIEGTFFTPGRIAMAQHNDYAGRFWADRVDGMAADQVTRTLADCGSAHCGDGIVDPGEACDDGNNRDGDCCTALCEAAPAGAACDDGRYCTARDACDAAGHCLGSGDPCAAPDGDANCSEACNEATRACDGQDPDASPCDDGLWCNGSDQCAGGACAAHAGSPCPGPDGDANCRETCQEASRSCIAPDPAGSPCNDGLFCTRDDACHAGGTCIGSGSPCPGADGDGDCSEECSEATDSCDAPDPVAAPCDDGLFCTTTDRCDGRGQCLGSGDPCSSFVGDGDFDCTEACDERSATCTAPDPDGAPCVDALACTLDERCVAGTCQGGSRTSCDDGNPCTDEFCAPDGSCLRSNNESPCDDGNACTTADRCHAGRCAGTGTVDCRDEDLCSADVCDPADGSCHHAWAPASTCHEAGLSSTRFELGYSAKDGQSAESLVTSWTGLRGVDPSAREEFADPTKGGRMALCFYDESEGIPHLAYRLDFSPDTQAEGQWLRNWRPSGLTYRLKAPAGTMQGVSQVRLGIDKDGTATLRLKAGADPGCDETCRARFHPPVGSEDGRLFRLDPGLTLQWVAEGGACWSSRYERAAENSGLGFRAQSKAR